jgi:hypothetical protein
VFGSVWSWLETTGFGKGKWFSFPFLISFNFFQTMLRRFFLTWFIWRNAKVKFPAQKNLLVFLTAVATLIVCVQDVSVFWLNHNRITKASNFAVDIELYTSKENGSIGFFSFKDK